MPKQRTVLSILGVSCLVLGLLLALAPASEAASHAYDVVASGLDNPRGLATGPEGALYVVEAGEGGDEGPIPGPFGPAFYGTSGAVTRVAGGVQTRIVTGLSSFANDDGGNAFGPHDISMIGRGGAMLTVGACFAPNATCGRLLRVSASGNWQAVSNISAFELANNPDGNHEGETNPYAALAMPGATVVTDAAGNTLLRVAPNGKITQIAVFPPRMVPSPSGGDDIRMDAVPTSVVVGHDGAYYVSELTGFPFPEGGARIYRVVPGQDPEIYAEDFTTIIDLAVEADGSLLVLQMTTEGILSGTGGALIRLHTDGTREIVLDEGLVAPSSVVVDGNGDIFISNHGREANVGEVIRLSESASVQQTAAVSAAGVAPFLDNGAHLPMIMR